MEQVLKVTYPRSVHVETPGRDLAPHLMVRLGSGKLIEVSLTLADVRDLMWDCQCALQEWEQAQELEDVR